MTLVGLALALSTVACGGSDGDNFERTDEGLTRVRVRLNWTLYGEHAFFLVGMEKGFYRDEGLDVHILQGSGSSTTVKLVGNGTEPIGYADAGTIMRAVSAGVPVKTVAVVLQRSPMAIIFPADRPIRDAGDLRGKQIAITAGDANSQIFPAVLARNDIAGSEVRMVSVANPMAKETMLLEDKVDAFLGYSMEQPLRLEEQTGRKMAWLNYADLGVNTLSSAIIVNETALAAHRETVQRFVRASMRALEYTLANPEEAARIFAEHAERFSPELAERQIRLMEPLLRTPASEGRPLGWSAEKDWRATQEVLTRYGGLPDTEDVSVYYTNELLTE